MIRSRRGEPGARRRNPRADFAANTQPVSRAKHGGRAADAPAELRIDVWQFVRIMVALEAMPASAAQRAWGGIWREIDDRLTLLGKTDPDAFAALMMDEDVVLPAPNRRVLDDAARALRRVDREISSALAERGLPADRRAELEFERRALRRRRRALARRPPRAGKAR